MLKILIIAVLIIAVGTGYAFYNYLKKPTPKGNIVSSVPVTKAPPVSSSSATLPEGLDDEKVTPNINVSDPNLSDSSKISLLESKLAVLQRRVETLEKGSGTSTIQASSTPTQTSKSTQYIPLGSGGNFTDRVYANFGGYIANIDPSSYPGYTGMQLEVSLRLNQPGEKVKARIFNSTDGSAISNSEVSTTSTSYVLLTSSNFTLPTGNKTYQMQVQSTDGVETFVQTARIKINY